MMDGYEEFQKALDTVKAAVTTPGLTPSLDQQIVIADLALDLAKFAHDAALGSEMGDEGDQP